LPRLNQHYATHRRAAGRDLGLFPMLIDIFPEQQQESHQPFD
jgi:hypothetical protein